MGFLWYLDNMVFRQYQNIVDIQRTGYLDQGVESDWTEIKLIIAYIHHKVT